MKRLDELGVSPAPWRIGEDEYIIRDKGYLLVAESSTRSNARLIAAAPDLYEALRLILASLDAIGFVPTVKEDALVRSFERGVRAIEKAGGAE